MNFGSLNNEERSASSAANRESRNARIGNNVSATHSVTRSSRSAARRRETVLSEKRIKEERRIGNSSVREGNPKPDIYGEVELDRSWDRVSECDERNCGVLRVNARLARRI